MQETALHLTYIKKKKKRLRIAKFFLGVRNTSPLSWKVFGYLVNTCVASSGFLTHPGPITWRWQQLSGR